MKKEQPLRPTEGHCMCPFAEFSIVRMKAKRWFIQGESVRESKFEEDATGGIGHTLLCLIVDHINEFCFYLRAMADKWRFLKRVGSELIEFLF